MSGEEDKKPVKNVKSKPAEKSLFDKTTEWLQDHSLVATTGGLIGAVAANEAEKRVKKQIINH